MRRARDLVKEQGTAADKVARRAATISTGGVGSQELRLDCPGDAGRDLVLDRKELGGLGVVLFGPDMRARGRLDQLCRYSNLLSGPANAAGEDVVRIGALANDREPAKAGKCSDDVLGDASRQRIALDVTGHVDEALHHDRWPGRNGRPGRNKSIAVSSKSIAHPSNGRDPVSARRMRSEELPQGRDLHRQIAFLDCNPRPCGVDQIGLCDDPVLGREQRPEQRNRLAARRHRRAVPEEGTAVKVEDEGSEGVALAAHPRTLDRFGIFRNSSTTASIRRPALAPSSVRH